MLLQMSNLPLLDAEVAEKPLQMITYVEPAIPSHTFMKFELTQQPSFGFLGWMEGRRLVARNTRTTKIKKCREVRGKHFVDTLSGSCLCQENVTVRMPCNPFLATDVFAKCKVGMLLLCAKVIMSFLHQVIISSKMYDPCPMRVNSTDFHNLN